MAIIVDLSRDGSLRRARGVEAISCLTRQTLCSNMYASTHSPDPPPQSTEIIEAVSSILPTVFFLVTLNDTRGITEALHCAITSNMHAPNPFFGFYAIAWHYDP